MPFAKDKLKTAFKQWLESGNSAGTPEIHLEWADKFALTSPTACFILQTDPHTLEKFKQHVGISLADERADAAVRAWGEEQKAFLRGDLTQDQFEAQCERSKAYDAIHHQMMAENYGPDWQDFEWGPATFAERDRFTKARKLSEAARTQIAEQVYGAGQVPEGHAGGTAAEWDKVHNIARATDFADLSQQLASQSQPTHATAIEAVAIDT